MLLPCLKHLWGLSSHTQTDTWSPRWVQKVLQTSTTTCLSNLTSWPSLFPFTFQTCSRPSSHTHQALFQPATAFAHFSPSSRCAFSLGLHMMAPLCPSGFMSLLQRNGPHGAFSEVPSPQPLSLSWHGPICFYHSTNHNCKMSPGSRFTFDDLSPPIPVSAPRESSSTTFIAGSLIYSSVWHIISPQETLGKTRAFMLWSRLPPIYH